VSPTQEGGGWGTGGTGVDKPGGTDWRGWVFHAEKSHSGFFKKSRLAGNKKKNNPLGPAPKGPCFEIVLQRKAGRSAGRGAGALEVRDDAGGALGENTKNFWDSPSAGVGQEILGAPGWGPERGGAQPTWVEFIAAPGAPYYVSSWERRMPT